MLTNLVGYWKLDESSGNATDAAGTNDLTDNGSCGTAAGKVGTCRTFDGSTQYLSHADNADLSAGDVDLTVAAWVRPHAVAAQGSIAGKHDGVGTAGSEWLLSVASSRFQFEVYSGSSSATALVANNFGAVAVDTWYHVVAWHDSVNNAIGISVNGTADTASWSAGLNDTAAAFVVGHLDNVAAVFYLNGAVDEVGFWKRALTSAERASLYNGGSGLAYSSFGVGPSPFFSRRAMAGGMAYPRGGVI